MKIALIGYGKMGQTLDRLAPGMGLEVVARFDHHNLAEFTPVNLQQAAVAIEFTRPEAALGNLTRCLEAGVPVVVGTTGWHDQLPVARARCAEYDGAVFWASNYSIGVNIFFALNRYLARLMRAFPEYSAQLMEIHHTAKLDAPSGTAITLAEDLLAQLPRYDHWVKGPANETNALGILSERIDPTPGTHEVLYQSVVDQIELRHVAHSREGFAVGALQAAKWLVGKRGFFGMEDLLSLAPA